ncbi:MAG TPA: bifunctional phosphopantothenoylcysteine decarboxylase/phosphopantothenate--cysteine ligase CoaBC [Opitutaceae bacterium]|nr:bifunctional phosphopantothenoylcysteine decarboxylase/phosphopantothenate--cysteine ligase CoaBC [Opitutaceae bacterium]
MSGSNIVFVLTGSIAGYKACDAISRLVKRGHRVRAVATESALRFVGAATLEGLTGERVLTDLFEPGAALEHIHLTRWADVVVVCPATANTLSRFAAGLADDLAGALFLAHDRSKPLLVAPAMNPAMWRHPATEEAVDRLARWGVRFIQPGEGRTACGEEGEGRLAEPPDIVDAVEAALARPARRLRVLVTSGGTAEPIDGVRVLTNASTGRTGAGIADHLVRCGHEAVLLRSRDSAPAGPGCRTETFSSFADLDAALARILSSEPFDAVIHAAAVSDFGVGEVVVDGAARPPAGGKLDSDSAPLLRLRPHPKLVDSLRSRSVNGSIRVVAFKLTGGGDQDGIERAVASLFAHSRADLVVHNSLAERAGGDAFPSEIHFADGSPTLRCATRPDLAAALERILVASAAAEAALT